jgi:hypothetical protein
LQLLLMFPLQMIRIEKNSIKYLYGYIWMPKSLPCRFIESGKTDFTHKKKLYDFRIINGQKRSITSFYAKNLKILKSLWKYFEIKYFEIKKIFRKKCYVCNYVFPYMIQQHMKKSLLYWKKCRKNISFRHVLLYLSLFTQCKHNINLTLSSTEPPLLILFNIKFNSNLAQKSILKNT